MSERELRFIPESFWKQGRNQIEGGYFLRLLKVQQPCRKLEDRVEQKEIKACFITCPSCEHRSALRPESEEEKALRNG